MRKKFCSVIVASVCVSSLIGTLSLASSPDAGRRPLPADHLSAGVFIDDDDFHLPLVAALDDVIFVFFVDNMGAHGLLHKMRPFHIVADEKAADAGRILSRGDALVRQMDALSVEFDFVILSEAGLALFCFGQFLSRPSARRLRAASFRRTLALSRSPSAA